MGKFQDTPNPVQEVHTNRAVLLRAVVLSFLVIDLALCRAGSDRVAQTVEIHIPAVETHITHTYVHEEVGWLG